MSYSEINESKIIQPSYDEDNEYKDNNCKVNFSSLMNNHSLIKSQNPFTKSQRDKGEESIIVTNSQRNNVIDNVIKHEGVEDQSCGCNCLNNNNVVVTIGSGSAENSWSWLTSIKDKISDIWDYLCCKKPCCVCDNETEMRLGDEINSQLPNK